MQAKMCTYCQPYPVASPKSGTLAEVNREGVFVAAAALVRLRVHWVHVAAAVLRYTPLHILSLCNQHLCLPLGT